jgi:hypothetical protein
MFGAGKAHFIQVKDNAKYRLVSKEAQIDALNSSYNIANITGTFDVPVLFAGYQAYLTIYINGLTRRNFAYSFNSIASYDYTVPVDNGFGIKQREIEIAQYLIPGVQSVGDPDGIAINNWSRESSVFIKTRDTQLGFTRPPLPFAEDNPNALATAVKDDSRYIISDESRGSTCFTPGKENPIKVIAYYGAIKNIAPAQWGNIYSYNTIDTGFQRDITPVTSPVYDTVFGGDTFISKFAFKTKLPFFIDNRVNAPDDSDIFYDEIGNVAYPKYWHSARSILSDASIETQYLKNFISIKAHNFDCPNEQTVDSPGRTYYDGKFYMFAYGIPYFYCETTYNVDLRQAFNNREGDFWPHVSTSIPDDWLQETFVPIIQDNTYYYNTTFSKQNKENLFTHLPNDWDQICYTNYPFRAIYSDVQSTDPDNRANNWLIYKPLSYFDFPQNYGPLTSLDGIQNKAILARFENKSLLYNTMLTIQTSNPQAAYMGNDTLFQSSPPIDFAETDLGYVGSQHKFILKVPQGQVTIDAKRGQVFLISGNQAVDLSAFGSGMNRFFTDHLAFEILRHFPDIPIDNHYNGIGLHGVYDSKFDRIIITKLDYIPKSDEVKYDATTNEFYIEIDDTGSPYREIVYLSDAEFFCNKSWTISFNLNTKSWVSFHSYLPNFYIAENNFFYSGLNECCADFEILLPPEPTTTTTSTSTSSTTTTSTTTTIYEGCDLDGDANVVDCALEGFANEAASMALKLTFDNIANITGDFVTDPADVNDWNTFFNLPLNGTPFTSVVVNGNTVGLYGGSGITILSNLFYETSNGYDALLEINDEAGCIVAIATDGLYYCYNVTSVNLPNLVSAASYAFGDMSSLVTANLPLLQTVGDACFTATAFITLDLPSATTIGVNAFSGCLSITSLSIESCTALGSTTGDDDVFGAFPFNISGNTITLTVPSALMTCNGGNPDGDIQQLQADNTVTVIQV